MTDEAQSPPSDEDIVARLMALEEQTPEEPEQPQAEAPPQDEDAQLEETAEDEPEAEQEPEPEFLELQYNGTIERVDRERAKTLAQQGLFYERNAGQVESQWKQAKDAYSAVVQQMQAAPEFREADAQVSLYERAIATMDPSEMQALATEDPAKYLTKLAEYNTLSRRLQEAKTRRDEVGKQVAEAQQRFQSETLAREREAMLRAVPDWRDKAKFEQARTRILGYMSERGFSEQELAGLMDHRALLVAYDAARFREGQKALKAKKLAEKPKVAKPGASVSKAEVADSQTKTLREQLKKTGKLEDAAKLFERFG